MQIYVFRTPCIDVSLYLPYAVVPTDSDGIMAATSSFSWTRGTSSLLPAAGAQTSASRDLVEEGRDLFQLKILPNLHSSVCRYRKKKILNLGKLVQLQQDENTEDAHTMACHVLSQKSKLFFCAVNILGNKLSMRKIDQYFFLSMVYNCNLCKQK